MTGTSCHTDQETTWSHKRTVERFNQEDVAQKYPAEFKGTFRDWCEKNAIRDAVSDLDQGSRVLDLPCGTGRLTRLLTKCGFDVTGADSSPHMVTRAHENWRKTGGDAKVARFEVRDALDTTYPDDSFDAVVCNRLFHHFNESETRVKAFRELKRISKHQVIVSFFNSFALDALRFRLKHFLRGTKPQDRIPIPLNAIVEDLEEAGLRMVAKVPVIWGLSPLWYIIAEHEEEAVVIQKPGTKRKAA
ncbi:Glycine/sarcosine N-methyltransferase [Polystyrenella longa]|uniref:Glycine/sarcosine N-methyltransferase n=1 Tax=Polystyrenella longa TaxID=2528007 RepID=A0A518CQT5_9PLAN|nr:class I SAM-dependent methyltransferase [Polystyrenella longa]QDU81589.1 Glycine/sarcosine N-methyltransferase [Polystyrenella longa]